MAIQSLPTANLPSLPVSFVYLTDSTKWETEKPYYISGPLPPEQEELRGNLEYENKDVTVYDLRGQEKTLKVERSGFELVNYPSPVSISLNVSEQDQTEEYLMATSQWLQERFGAERVYCYAFRYRRVGSEDEWEGLAHDIGTRVKPDKATVSPHVDQTVDGGLRRARRHMTSVEAGKYLDGNWRVRIVNVWRPLDHPVEDAPLAFCDYPSLNPRDMIAADRVSEQYVGEVYYVRYNKKQRWFWFNNQTPDEVVLLLSYDSNPGDGPKYCAHTSFTLPDTTEDTPRRQSIEVRAIVITKD